LPGTLQGHSHVQSRKGAIAIATISNLTDPDLIGDPPIKHGLVTNRQKRYYGFKRAKWLGYFCSRVQLVVMNSPAKITDLLDCIGKVIGIRGSCHPGFKSFFLSRHPVRISKSYAQKKGAQEAFDDEIN
jgi:hypothetical protein